MRNILVKSRYHIQIAEVKAYADVQGYAWRILNQNASKRH